MNNATTNYALADYVNNINFGIIRGVRCIRINKSSIGIRLTHILYMQGVLRFYKIENEYIAIFFKLFRSRHIISRLKVISKPSVRCSWKLAKLVRHINTYNFTGFYIISTQKGIYTSDYCLLQAHISGEILIRVEL